MSVVRRRVVEMESARLWIFAAGMGVGLLVLVAALGRLQVAEASRFEGNLAQQSVRRVWLPGARGAVFDRRGHRLIENRPAYTVAVYLEELRRPGSWARTIAEVDRTLDDLAVRLQRPREVTATDVERHIRARLPLPFPAWRDLGEDGLARWAEQAIRMRGVDVVAEAVRHYPQGTVAAHVLGHVGRADFVQPEDQPYHYYIPEMEGRLGIERRYDEVLRGASGGRLVRVDVSGFRHEDLGQRDPESGRDLVLTLDLRIQRLAEQALEGAPGAVVVVDPRNGEVLAMASFPAFNPNDFVPSLSPARWAALRDDPDQPLFHRAAAGAYPPGSIFKPVTALASLVNGFSTPHTSITCAGAITLGRSATFRCWERNGHGPLDLRGALRHSCNVYFYRLALASGADVIAAMARALGLGRPTGIDLDHEVSGLVPDDAWKRRTHGDAWRDGDTCNISIGQGALAVTPLQMAMLTAAVANGGYLFRPRLVLGIREPGSETFERTRPEVVNDLGWPPGLVRDIRAGMVDAVMSDRGTGRLARIPGITVAGKTGTAEFGPKGAGLKRGWMIAYAPAEAPRYAIAMVTDEAVGGGATVAPRLRMLLDGIFYPEPELGEGPR